MSIPTIPRWTVPPSTSLSVMDYGAEGDGITDDRAAFQSCIDAAVTKGRWVYLPPATYKLNSAPAQNYSLLLPSDLRMRGCGGASILSSTATYPLRATAKSGVTLRDFALDSDYASGGSGQAGIHLSGTCTNWLLQNLTVTDMLFCGIYSADALVSSLIKGCSVSHCGDFGIHIKTGSNYTTISDCVCHGFASMHYAGHGIYVTSSDHVTIENCECYDVAHLTGGGDSGIQVRYGDSITVSGCSCHDNAQFGFVTEGSSAVSYTSCAGAGNTLGDFYEYYTPVPSYAGCTGTIVQEPLGMPGNTATGASGTTLYSDYKKAAKFYMQESKSVTKLTAYISTDGSGSGNQVHRGFIYQGDDATAVLKGVSAEVTITDGAAVGWYDFVFASPVALTAGWVLLGILSGAADSACKFRYSASSGGVRLNADDTYADGAEDPFGVIAATNYEQLCIYATYA